MRFWHPWFFSSLHFLPVVLQSSKCFPTCLPGALPSCFCWGWWQGLSWLLLWACMPPPLAQRERRETFLYTEQQDMNTGYCAEVRCLSLTEILNYVTVYLHKLLLTCFCLQYIKCTHKRSNLKRKLSYTLNFKPLIFKFCLLNCMF